MIKRILKVIGVAAVGLVVASGMAGAQSFQYQWHGDVGNTVSLTDGDTTVWDGTYTEDEFLSKLYAWDGQVVDYMIWTQDQPNGMSLQLSDASNYADGSVTMKFVAPEGKVFTGGNIICQAMGVWGNCTLDLKAYSQYISELGGFGGYKSGVGVLYGSDTHTKNAEWQPDIWTVAVPQNKHEFYVTVASRVDYHSVWASFLSVTGVTTGDPVTLQPYMRNVYGNSFVLPAGNKSIISGADATDEVIAKTYAVNAQSEPDYMVWTQNEPNGEYLKFSDAGHWADGSVTWKFVAPTDSVFSGGTIKMSAMGIWGSCQLDLIAHSAYADDGGWGIGGYTEGNGTLYNRDNHTNNAEWAWDDWTVQVPAGVKEFYVTAAARTDSRTVWARSLTSSDVTLQTITLQPEIHNPYGNSVTLQPGDSHIWSSSDSTTDMISKAYAVDAQFAPNYMKWTQNEPSGYALQFSSTDNWANGSVTWKFVAPAGKMFTGGTITTLASGVYDTPTSHNALDLKAYSAYSIDDAGFGGYTAGNGVLYDSDNKTMPDWNWTTYAVHIPANVTEFYVTAASREPYHYVWSSVMNAVGVTMSDLTSVSIPSVKTSDENATVSTTGIVTESFPDTFYIEATDRSSGIRVAKAGYNATVGKAATVVGKIVTLPSGERQIAADSATEADTTAVIRPLFMNGKSIGGGTLGTLPNGQVGVQGGTGLNNIGIYVRFFGQAMDQGLGAGTYAISDASGAEIYVKMLTGTLTDGAYVIVNGVVSLDANGKPVILVSGINDVTTL